MTRTGTVLDRKPGRPAKESNMRETLQTTYYLSTSDPDIVIVVPEMDSDITIADRNDLPEYIESLPAAYQFRHPCELNDEALAEVAEAVEASGYDITVNYERMAITGEDFA